MKDPAAVVRTETEAAASSLVAASLVAASLVAASLVAASLLVQPSANWLHRVQVAQHFGTVVFAARGGSKDLRQWSWQTAVVAKRPCQVGCLRSGPRRLTGREMMKVLLTFPAVRRKMGGER